MVGSLKRQSIKNLTKPGGPSVDLSTLKVFLPQNGTNRHGLVNGEKTIVVQALPKSSLEGTHPYGKIWVRESDFAILKIEWDQKSLKALEELKKQASMFDADQKITIISEFGYEEKGIRFPSRFLFEEAYVNKEGKKVVRSMIHTVYRDYKFFAVDVDVDFK